MTNINLVYLTLFKSKLQKLIKTNKCSCIINYATKVNKSIKWKLSNILVIFDNEDIRNNFQSIVANELNNCKHYSSCIHFIC